MLFSPLRDFFDPIPAGVQVFRWRDVYSGRLCTIGANVATGYGYGFVTVSHCTATPWDLDYGFYSGFYQPGPGDNYFVGYEFADPTPAELGRVCDPYDLCRLSDAAFIKYDVNVEDIGLGYIARTEGYGSLTVNIWHPRFEIVDEAGWLLVGADVHMMGRTSGWTTGEVTETCVDRPQWFGSGTILLCQTQADYNSGDGDSGAPVFTWDLSGDAVTLEGIHAGKDEFTGLRYFSPWISVAFELGAILGSITALP